MIHYTISGTGNNRILQVVKNSLQRFRFYEIGETVDGQRELVPVKFSIIGAKAISAVSDMVMVYTVPNSNDYHREYMQHNARAMWCGLEADPERLLNNMLEYVESI